MKNFEESARGSRYVSWILRGSLFLVAFFYLLLSFDVFSINASLLQRFEGFLVHNIYTFIMFLILYIAWESENLAGFLLIGMSISMVSFFGGPSGIRLGLTIMISLTSLVGLLFLMNYYLIGKKE